MEQDQEQEEQEEEGLWAKPVRSAFHVAAAWPSSPSLLERRLLSSSWVRASRSAISKRISARSTSRALVCAAADCDASLAGGAANIWWQWGQVCAMATGTVTYVGIPMLPLGCIP